MKENVKRLAELGRIPDSTDMNDELFNLYEELITVDEPLTFEEAELLITLFSEDDSDDCYDLNWKLLHTIETVFSKSDIERYKTLISKCNNAEFKETLETRLNNSLS